MTEQAFALAAAELGMASASWLFVDQFQGDSGSAGVQLLRDSLGRRWPVLDAVCAARLSGAPTPRIQLEPVLALLAGLRRLLVVGLETLWLDALLPVLQPGIRLGLLRHSELRPDWTRVCANFERPVELIELSGFQAWAGRRSALLCFVYGPATFAPAAWARVWGPDTRSQFRDLIAWEVLGCALPVYPRWLVASAPSQFSHLVSA